MAPPFQIVKGPVSLPIGDEPLGIGRVKAQAAAPQRDAENTRHFAQLHQRRHDWLDVNLEELRLKTFLQGARRRVREKPAFLDEPDFRTALGLIHVMRRYKNRDPAVAQV